MRIALLTLPYQLGAVGDDNVVTILGRSIQEWQCDLALELGCEKVLLVAPALTEDALDIQHQAEAGGAKFQIVPHAHRLLGQLHTDDDLLVLDPKLLAQGSRAREVLTRRRRIFALPNVADRPDFERLDKETVWAGAAWLPGGMVERLSDFGSDADPASALLRIAASLGLRRETLPTDVIGSTEWASVTSASAGREIGRTITTARLGSPSNSPGDWLAHAVARQFLIGGRQGSVVAAVGAAISLAILAGCAALLVFDMPLLTVPAAGFSWFVSRVSAHSAKVAGWNAWFTSLLSTLTMMTLVVALAYLLALEMSWAIAAFVSLMVAAWAVEATRSARFANWFRDGTVAAAYIGLAGASGHIFAGAVLAIALSIGIIWGNRFAHRS